MEKDYKCPKCGCEMISLKDFEVFEAQVDGQCAVIEWRVGTCYKCHAKIEWEEVYIFAGYRNIEIIDENGAE